MKVLVTGDGGQLAYELSQTQPEGIKLVSLSAQQLDITDRVAVFAWFEEVQPSVVINAAAYTAVDRAETDSAKAYAVNESGAENLALACRQLSAKLVHISTDFVFDGSSTTPYQPDDKPNPLSVYGSSKLAGEQKVSEVLGQDAVIVRTAWVYSSFGNNFVKSMIRLMAEKEQLGVIYDQVGTPTWAKGLAELSWRLAELLANGRLPRTEVSEQQALMLHWTDAGVASWFDFAVAIQELALEKGLLDKAIPVRPIPTSEYPTPAKRPAFSVIDKSLTAATTGKDAVHWRVQLSRMLDELKAQSR
ncbi:dTDP-4-dehydrorhamnose reductase [Ferrimonas balearica]|uniref:dTDP-4-dehydrorhamnose reductase n=1 Tax=Ferrimonas balearica TaxID=44012 RepID=UPI001C990327|nr:dTDP-4-dehydrorhamnose reductase [Ferrimonas balearica]MBY5990778.1 dTDP-4-dehydrorhamnose reductase [Ferrimonas balearica]